MRIEQPARAAGRKTVVVVGAGWVGFNPAKRLSNHDGIQVDIIDRRNHHLFQPLLYQVATAGLNPSDIAVPIRAQFRHAKNVDIHLGRIERVDLDQQLVVGGGHELAYDYLIVACGAHHSYFGHPEWEPYAPVLKTIEQATEIRRRIL
jgi:NADH dehydrogenase